MDQTHYRHLGALRAAILQELRGEPRDRGRVSSEAASVRRCASDHQQCRRVYGRQMRRLRGDELAACPGAAQHASDQRGQESSPTDPRTAVTLRSMLLPWSATGGRSQRSSASHEAPAPQPLRSQHPRRGPAPPPPHSWSERTSRSDGISHRASEEVNRINGGLDPETGAGPAQSYEYRTEVACPKQEQDAERRLLCCAATSTLSATPPIPDIGPGPLTRVLRRELDAGTGAPVGAFEVVG